MLKTSFKALLSIVFIAILIASCSRKNNSFVSRNYHAVTAKFNTLYNGYNALEQGRNSLNETYVDNYWEILPIERMEIQDESILPKESKNENFTISEEKAVKTIQKHGMNFKGKEKNPQIDEAYLLLGKARYFDQRFIQALESFNYILYKYPASDKINQAKIWREKTNIRLENEELAIKNLKHLLKQEELDGQDLADATSILAQAYLNIKVVDTAITQLEVAANTTKSNDERGRYRFIQGQLYNRLGYRDSANIAFDKVIELNRKTPRIYLINAHIEKIKNFNYTSGNKLDLLELLTELKENRENKAYLDKIYHQIAQYHLENGSDDLAVSYYNKSLRTKSLDKQLKARNYQILGDMNFDKSMYLEAGTYFDSTMSNLASNSKPYRIIKRKKDNLEDVIFYEDIAQVNDSILRLVNLSENQRLAYFETFVDDLKIKAEQEKEETTQRSSGLATSNNNLTEQAIQTSGLPNQSSTFYFYNPTTVAYGKNEFIKIWGDRTLEDNWRWSNKSSSSNISTTSSNNILAIETDNDLFNPQFYISKIPTEVKEIDSISKERNYAYYQLGLIYKEKFKEYHLAKEKFQNLLNSNPDEQLILPSKYNLYKIYELLEENDKASIAKNEIVDKYPESRYAIILTNPKLAILKDENSPENLYEKVYEQHENQEYAKVVSKCEEYIIAFDGEPIVPKFELLKATALGRLYGYETYSKAIDYVAVTYANTNEGKQAKNIESEILTKLADNEFVANNTLNNFKVVFQFHSPEAKEVSDFRKELDSVLKNIKYYKLKTSVDVYSPKTTLIVVHGLTNGEVAKTFNQLLTKEDKKKITKPHFVISSKNYQIIQIHKNLDAYLNISNN